MAMSQSMRYQQQQHNNGCKLCVPSPLSRSLVLVAESDTCDFCRNCKCFTYGDCGGFCAITKGYIPGTKLSPGCLFGSWDQEGGAFLSILWHNGTSGLCFSKSTPAFLHLSCLMAVLRAILPSPRKSPPCIHFPNIPSNLDIWGR